jgi:hypothetical protein
VRGGVFIALESPDSELQQFCVEATTFLAEVKDDARFCTSYLLEGLESGGGLGFTSSR